MTTPISRRDALLGVAASALAFEPLARGVENSFAAPFLVKPYVQLGDAPRLAREEQISVLWHAPDRDERWNVQFRMPGMAEWTTAAEITETRVAVTSIPPHRVIAALLRPLAPGANVEYRVRRGDVVEFSAITRARVAADQPFRCVVVGDCGTGSPQQKKVAYQIHRRQPAFVLVPGDLVYNDGRISEYRASFYPIYSQASPSPEHGAPLLSSTMVLGARGQHDTQADLAKHPDGHAYFLYWSFPLNGPELAPGGPNVFPLGGSAEEAGAFRTAAGRRFPLMANYSFDWGNTHWTVLDTWNPQIDWTDTELRAWLKADLAAARDATWKFVSSYMPPFSSSTKYPQGQKMRVIADLLEEAGVDIVFSGYAHSYQRTPPLRFSLDPLPQRPVRDPAMKIPGRWRLDTRFDGREVTRADGVIYVVTGCGGNPELHSPEQTDDPQSWQPYTVKYNASLHQFTELEIAGKRLTLRQISLEGEELDRMELTKN